MACQASYDEAAGTFTGSCAVPLTSIKIDNEDTKTEHFQQWATNRKVDPKSCQFAARFTDVKVGRLAPEVPASFATDIPFTVCGRARADGGKEHVHGHAVLLPAGSYGAVRTIRVRATVITSTATSTTRAQVHRRLAGARAVAGQSGRR